MKKAFIGLFGLLLLISLFWLHQVSRSSFSSLWGLYTIAFAAYVFLVFKYKLSLKAGLTLALLIRLTSFLSEPHLSDDYYRYIWDGAVTSAGINPMAYTPGEILDHPEWINIPNGFFENLNSPEYFAVYPPVLQGVFYVSYQMHGWNIHGHILFYKFLLFIADLLILGLLYLWLMQKKQPAERILIYALNPLIILEFTGNLHFDSFMILGLLAAIFLMQKNKIWGSSFSMAFSILSKLLTLPLLLFFLKAWSLKKGMAFIGLTVFMTVFIFVISFGGDRHGLQSILLWFKHFEFNAGLYYLLRALGYAGVGYNGISYLGPFLALISGAGILWIWIRFVKGKIKSPETGMLLAMTLYFLFSTTVHPWYIAMLLVLGILSGFSYPILWTYLIYLSYSHYEGGHFKEHYGLMALEYLGLFLFMILEIKKPAVIKRFIPNL